VEERREHARYEVWFPVRIEAAGGDGEALAVSKDAGSGGISISSAKAFQVGARVKVAFRGPSENSVEREVAGIIVRFDRNPDALHGNVWPYRMAIAFDSPLPELEGVMRVEKELP
jgi:hypothetical protein